MLPEETLQAFPDESPDRKHTHKMLPEMMTMSDLERGLRRCLANLDKMDAIMAEMREMTANLED